ncbi:type I secretion system permease/ATPase [Piscinibacter sp. Jin2]|uniref:Type I secretion system permease/ATPase n=1 Tax=Aquariibacter lacus TaxID=2801332 RepID=A0A9X0XFS3_9BURK|nr:type I secretion system permease/ATPase [Piscinibacter lacus]MBL0720278.1 type I secretion system permease/ATPase [Piscinibacter lacus]
MSTPDPRPGLGRMLWAFRKEFLLAGLFSMVANLLMLTPTLYMLQVFDRVYISQSELTLLVVTVIMVMLVGWMAAAEWLRSRLLVRVGVQLDTALAERVYRASFRAELTQSGHQANQALGDLTQLRQFLTGNGAIAFFDAPWTPVYIVVSWLLHPTLGLLALVFVIHLLLLALLNQLLTRRAAQQAGQAEVAANAYLLGKLRNSELIATLGMLGDLRRRWLQRHRAAQAAQARAQDRGQAMTTVVKFVRYSQQSLSLGAGAWLAIQGEISLGAMIAASVLMSRASAPIEMLVSTWSQFQSARAAHGRLAELLAEHPEAEPGRQRHRLAGAVTLQGFSATAPGRVEPIVHPLDLHIPAGQVLAILGPSGSGKSTLARGLLGIWPQAGGRVLLDGEDLAGQDRAALGPQVGYLPQDVELFEGSLAENIARFGKVDAPQVIAAAQRAGLHELILRFPRGYDTPIGPSGAGLSGGQRQRIGLARAMYGDPQLLVLDEPNANLDDAGELALLRAVEDLKARGKTVVLITHRGGVLQQVDRLLLMQQGRIVADGPRDAVLASLRPPQNPASAGPLAGANPVPA